MRVFKVLFLCLLLVAGTVGSAGAQPDFSCDDFTSQRAAQAVLLPSNEDELDPDGDGVACEELSDDDDRSNDRDNDRDESERDRDSITHQEREYIDAVNKGLLQMGDASTELGELFRDAGEDVLLFRDQDWIVDVATQFVVIQQVGEDAKELDPSARQEHIQDLWLAINELTTTAVDEYTVGIDSLDPESIEQGAERYKYAALLVGDLIEARDAFNEDPTNNPPEPEYTIGPVQECDEFESYAEAQEYYPAHPEEQETIDPDFDGRACEVHFGRE